MVKTKELGDNEYDYGSVFRLSIQNLHGWFRGSTGEDGIHVESYYYLNKNRVYDVIDTDTGNIIHDVRDLSCYPSEQILNLCFGDGCSMVILVNIDKCFYNFMKIYNHTPAEKLAWSYNYSNSKVLKRVEHMKRTLWNIESSKLIKFESGSFAITTNFDIKPARPSDLFWTFTTKQYDNYDSNDYISVLDLYNKLIMPYCDILIENKLSSIDLVIDPNHVYRFQLSHEILKFITKYKVIRG
jgi:hypothetical protein